jgi:hypothetical protein
MGNFTPDVSNPNLSFALTTTATAPQIALTHLPSISEMLWSEKRKTDGNAER